MTIAQAVDELISASPFLEEALADELINVSSLARKLQPMIEKKLHKEVQPGAIVMAINRRPSGLSFRISKEIREFMRKLGDVIVRSDLRDYTFENSAGLIACNRKLMDEIAGEKEIFCTISQGVFETTLVVSNLLKSRIKEIYQKEKLLAKKTRLSSITLRLPESNTEVSGIYYFLLKNLAWSGINVCEVISTSNEVTFVVEEKDVHRAFSRLMDMKHL
ncbi:MAG: aspartate kinase [Bacteroidales bacterium]|nr:aspartate kinase [Bacteroidales bacterium]